jgi:hypothetical protein
MNCVILRVFWNEQKNSRKSERIQNVSRFGWLKKSEIFISYFVNITKQRERVAYPTQFDTEEGEVTFLQNVGSKRMQYDNPRRETVPVQ